MVEIAGGADPQRAALTSMGSVSTATCGDRYMADARAARHSWIGGFDGAYGTGATVARGSCTNVRRWCRPPRKQISQLGELSASIDRLRGAHQEHLVADHLLA